MKPKLVAIPVPWSVVPDEEGSQLKLLFQEEEAFYIEFLAIFLEAPELRRVKLVFESIAWIQFLTSTLEKRVGEPGDYDWSKTDPLPYDYSAWLELVREIKRTTGLHPHPGIYEIVNTTMSSRFPYPDFKHYILFSAEESIEVYGRGMSWSVIGEY